MELTTEEKIIAAARKLFTQKGFSATRTRDIAEEAGINLALLNYYFRSKEKLFIIIMTETLSSFLQHLTIILNDMNTGLEKKIELIASNYIDFLLGEPELPLFLMSELRNNAGDFIEKLALQDIFVNSEFFKQYSRAVEAGEVTEPNAFQMLLNILGFVVFPFIAQPMIAVTGKIDNKHFVQMMRERKRRVPVWVKAILKA